MNYSKWESVQIPSSISSSRNIQNEKVCADHYRETVKMKKCTINHRSFCQRESIRDPASILSSGNIQNEKVFAGQCPFCRREKFWNPSKLTQSTLHSATPVCFCIQHRGAHTRVFSFCLLLRFSVWCRTTGRDELGSSTTVGSSLATNLEKQIAKACV